MHWFSTGLASSLTATSLSIEQNSVDSVSHAAHIGFLLDEHLHQWQPACPSNKTVSIVSVTLHTLIFCWMSIFQPTATSLSIEQNSVNSVSHAAHIDFLLDEHLSSNGNQPGQ